MSVLSIRQRLLKFAGYFDGVFDFAPVDADNARMTERIHDERSQPVYNLPAHAKLGIVFLRGESMADKKIYWIGSSKGDISSFPQEAKRKAGFQLRAIQRVQKPTDFKPMPTIGKDAEEIRIWTGDAYRVFYVSRFEDAVYVLHAFQKKAQKTSKRDIELGQKRYAEMIQYRQHKGS